MSSLSSEFLREQRAAIRVKESRDIFKAPLPESTKNWYISGTDIYRVQGIKEEYYNRLNDTDVKKLPAGYVAKRRKIDKVTRSFKRDSEGNFVYENVPIAANFMAVTSEENISLPFKYKPKEKGFDYIDYVTKNGKREFIYSLCKANLYKVNQTALALSVKNMKNFKGMGYRTWRMGIVFLHVIPYNPRSSYIGSKILETGVGIDVFDAHVREIVDYWQQVNYIPNIELSRIGYDNFVLRETMVGYDDYIEVQDMSVNEKEIYGAESDDYSDSGQEVPFEDNDSSGGSDSSMFGFV